MKTITTLLIAGLLMSGCAGIDTGFGTLTSPPDMVETRGEILHKTDWNEEGVKLSEIKVGRFLTKGENDISNLLIEGSLENGSLTASADQWSSSKEATIQATGERESGNVEAAGDAVPSFGGALSEILDATQPNEPDTKE